MSTLCGLVLTLALFAFPALAGQAPSSQCVRFNVVKYDGQLLAFGQFSDSQQKWWESKGSKKYKGACLDANAPDYLIVWGSEMENRQGVAFVYHPGVTSTSNVQMSNGDSGTVTTTTNGTTQAVPTVRALSHVHIYVFAWRDGKVEGPIWIKDRTGEGWGERGWSQTHPASQQLLEDALKFLMDKKAATSK
jgi:hypothetical protein